MYTLIHLFKKLSFNNKSIFQIILGLIGDYIFIVGIFKQIKSNDIKAFELSLIIYIILVLIYAIIIDE